MISYLFSLLVSALNYAKNHPQILFALLLVLIIPLLFLYTGQQFLDVGKSNQERLQKDKVGIMHDILSSLLLVTKFDQYITDLELKKIAELNPDIIDYKIAKKEVSGIVPFIALNHADVGVPEEKADLYINASVRTDESIIFESFNDGERIWEAYRAVHTQEGEVYFIYTAVSLKSVDDLFAAREHKAYFSLIFVYFFVIALAYWHIQLTDYRYLYIKAQKINETKDLFTNMITHELRTPLTVMQGYAEILSSTLTVIEQKEQALRIKNSSQHLLVIVNDLLDIARIQSGKLEVVHESVEVASIVKNVVTSLEIIALEKNVALKTQGIEQQYTITADKKRLEQALINVVSNALKYTKQGEITIVIEDKHSSLEIRVKDTGMGISSDDQKKLFAPFFRVAGGDMSTISGTGLGMWITKELVELMGGTIGVESIRGIGTQIVITFPLQIRVS